MSGASLEYSGGLAGVLPLNITAKRQAMHWLSPRFYA